MEPGFPASTRVRTFAGERVISAVSLAEKNPERKRRMRTRTMSEVTKRFKFMCRGNDTGLGANYKHFWYKSRDENPLQPT